MSKVTFIDPIDHISGKITKKHRTIYCYRTGTGAKYTTVYTKPAGDPSAAQTAAKNKFAQAAAQVKIVFANTTQLDTYRTAWWAQLGSGKYKTLRGYVFAEVLRTL